MPGKADGARIVGDQHLVAPEVEQERIIQPLHERRARGNRLLHPADRQALGAAVAGDGVDQHGRADAGAQHRDAKIAHRVPVGLQQLMRVGNHREQARDGRHGDGGRPELGCGGDGEIRD